MKFRFLIFCFLFCSIGSFSQVPDSLISISKDTLETIVSDSAIIYVIQEAPVMIIEKVKVVKPKAHYYLSLNISLLAFAEYKKARPSYEQYLSMVNDVTKNLPGYSFNLTLWKCPKKIYTEYSVSFTRLFQEFAFTYTDTFTLNKHIYPESLGASQSATNNFNYLYVGSSLGYWAKKQHKISYIPSGGISVANLLSYSSYTLSKEDPIHPESIRREIRYKEFIFDLALQIRCLIRSGKNLFEITPYCRFSPISITSVNAPYSVHRALFGIRVGFNNKLF
jgi:hypothetical protein